MDDRRSLDARAAAFIPLKSTWFQMLLVLAGGPRHGYAIRAEVEERTDGAVRLWPTTLYGSLARMAAEGLIEETEADPLDGNDAIERVFYRLTPLGRRLLTAETDRLADLVRLSRSRMATSGS